MAMTLVCIPTGPEGTQSKQASKHHQLPEASKDCIFYSSVVEFFGSELYLA